MALLLAEGIPVHGIVYRGTRYDTGMPLGYLQAVVQIACEREDLGPAFSAVAGRVRPDANSRGTDRRIEAMTATDRRRGGRAPS